MSSLGLILPTYNRPNYLKNIVNYYSDSGLQIQILDGSPDSLADFSFPSSGFKYYHYPQISSDKSSPQGSYLRRLCSALERTDSQYSLLITDDDYFNPACIFNCSKFLSENNDYVSCMGLPYSVMQVPGTKKVKVKHLYKCINPLSISPPDISMRNYLNFSRYSPRYSYALTHTSLLKKIYKVFFKYNYLEIFSWQELLLEITLSTHGRCKVLNMPYWIRGSAPKIKRSKPVLTFNDYLQYPRNYEIIFSIFKDLCVALYGSLIPDIFESYCLALDTYLRCTRNNGLVDKEFGAHALISGENASSIFKSLAVE